MRPVSLFLAASMAILGMAPVARADSARAAQLKEQILEISTTNNGRRDNLQQVRRALDPLVTELAGLRQQVTAEQDLQATVGAWKEVWSDDTQADPPSFSTDRDAVYQVITPDGYFYNISELVGFLGFRVTGLLRGVYQAREDRLEIEFTNVGIQLNSLGRTDLYEFVQAVESGRESYVVPPGDLQAPNGPIGARGQLKNLYVDEQIRIAQGQNNADGVVDLYVMVRASAPFRLR
jgi:hypothetical protein